MQNAKQTREGNRPLPRYLLTFFRIGFGLIFIVSGSFKIIDLAGFENGLSKFGIVPEQFVPGIAIVIPAIEIVIGIAISIGFQIAIVSQAALVLLIMFTAVVVAKMSEGAQISCACFGPLSSDQMSTSTILRNIILIFWGVSLAAINSPHHTIAQIPNRARKQKKIRDIASLDHTAVNSSQTSFGKTFQRITGIIVVAFLAVEVILLSTQNRELKNRLAMLLGNGIYGSLKAGETVPPFTANDINGNSVEITYDNMNSKTLLLVFSTTCSACERNLPNWSEIASRLKGSSRRVIGISLDAPDSTRQYVLENELQFTVLVPAEKKFLQDYKISYTPQTIVINPQGRVKQIWNGVLDSQQKAEAISELDSAP